MFKSITWQEFIVAISVVAACYYAFIVAVFYRKDIGAKLKGQGFSTAPVKTPNQPHPKNLMGAIAPSTPIRKKPLAESSANAEEVQVADLSIAPEIEHPSTPADELIQELRNLFEIMKEGKPSQDAYLKNVKTLISQYAHLIGPEEFTRISLLIIKELKAKHDIFLTIDLIEELWPKETIKHSNNSK